MKNEIKNYINKIIKLNIFDIYDLLINKYYENLNINIILNNNILYIYENEILIIKFNK